MQVEIYGRDVYITDTLRGYIERRLGFALDRFARSIRKVVVRFADLNGPRGGIDTRCQLAIFLAPSSTILMENRASNVYVAIDGLAAKAGNCIGRRLQRAYGHGPSQRISEMLFQEPQDLVVAVDRQGGDRVHKNAAEKDSGS